MQIKITLRFHLTLLEVPSSKMPLTTGVGQDMRKKGESYTADGNAR
jgi:hypothetical protein